ncbi:MAG: hypothetical protein IJK54_01770 [Clostridia bacterium]|nr:hypothetical protein [Clostridia bacterium]
MASHVDPVAWAKKVKIRRIVLIILAALLLAGGITVYLLRDRIIPALRYARAEIALNNGNIAEAIELFQKDWTYRDANDRAAELAFAEQTDPTLRETLKSAKPGDVVYFGSYEQDNAPMNGKEPIEWFVMVEKDDRLLLWSNYALDAAKYNNTANVETTWETCSLRTWLNDTFLHTAFTEQEQLLIPKMSYVNNGNEASLTKGGDDTEDYVVIMSFDELLEYGLRNPHLEWIGTYPTVYAAAQGVESHSDYGTCKWWIRTPGLDQTQVVYCDMVGQPLYSAPATRNGIGVRPMIWVVVGDRGE